MCKLLSVAIVQPFRACEGEFNIFHYTCIRKSDIRSYDNIPGYKPNDVRVYYLVCILHVCSGAYMCVCFSAGHEVVITGRNVALFMIRECHSHVHAYIILRISG